MKGYDDLNASDKTTIDAALSAASSMGTKLPLAVEVLRTGFEELRTDVGKATQAVSEFDIALAKINRNIATQDVLRRDVGNDYTADQLKKAPKVNIEGGDSVPVNAAGKVNTL